MSRRAATSRSNAARAAGNPPSHSQEYHPEYRAFLVRSLNRNDTDMAALMELNRSLHRSKDNILKQGGECLLLDLGEGIVKLSPNTNSDELEVPEDYKPLTEETRKLCVDFLLRMKLRRKLLNRLARRLNRLAHAMDGEDVAPPGPPKYGDLRLHVDQKAVELYAEHWSKQEEARLDLIKTKKASPQITRLRTKEEEEAHRRMYVNEDETKTDATKKQVEGGKKQEDNADEVVSNEQEIKISEKLAGPDTEHPANPVTEGDKKQGEHSPDGVSKKEDQPAVVSSSEVDDLEILKEYTEAYDKIVNVKTGAVHYKILDDEASFEEDYAAIKFGAGIGAAHRSMSTREKEAEWKRWQTALLARIPDQPTFEELGMKNRVFALEKRRKRALELAKEDEAEGSPKKKTKSDGDDESKGDNPESSDDDADTSSVGTSSDGRSSGKETSAKDEGDSSEEDIKVEHDEKEVSQSTGESKSKALLGFEEKNAAGASGGGEDDDAIIASTKKEPTADSNENTNDMEVSSTDIDEDKADMDIPKDDPESSVASRDEQDKMEVLQEGKATADEMDDSAIDDKSGEISVDAHDKMEVGSSDGNDKMEMDNVSSGGEEAMKVDTTKKTRESENEMDLDGEEQEEMEVDPAKVDKTPDQATDDDMAIEKKLEDAIRVDQVALDKTEGTSEKQFTTQPTVEAEKQEVEGGSSEEAAKTSTPGDEEQLDPTIEQKNVSDKERSERDECHKEEIEGTESKVKKTKDDSVCRPTTQDAVENSESSESGDSDGDIAQNEVKNSQGGGDVQEAAKEIDGENQEREDLDASESPKKTRHAEETKDGADDPPAESGESDAQENADAEKDDLPKKAKPISLVAVPSFFEQDLKRIKLIHEDLMASSMHEHARARLSEVTADYNSALRKSNEINQQLQRLQGQLNSLLFEQKSKMAKLQADYSVEVARARKQYEARKFEYDVQRAKQSMPSHWGRIPIGTPGTRRFASLRGPSSAGSVIGSCVADLVDACIMKAEGKLPPWKFDAFIPPPAPDFGDAVLNRETGETLKQKHSRMESALRKEITALTVKFHASEEDRKQAWKKMLKTKGEYEVPPPNYGGPRRRQQDLTNAYSTIPVPALMASTTQHVPQEFTMARTALPTYTPNRNYHPSSVSESKYSAARVRERISADGTVAPVSEPKKTKDGLYQRPAGRTRKGMEWDAVRGIWVPARRS